MANKVSNIEAGELQIDLAAEKLAVHATAGAIYWKIKS